VATELNIEDASYPPHVLVAHGEMTAQAHDGDKWGWVLKGEQPLRKKGAGHGIHQSDFICSTVGWLKDANVSLEYGKNHDGFWNGSLFVKQVCPAALKFSCDNLADSYHSLRRSFSQRFAMHISQGLSPSSWLTTPKVMLHLLMMLSEYRA